MANPDAKSVEVKDLSTQKEDLQKNSLKRFEESFGKVKEIKNFSVGDKKMSIIKQKQDGVDTVYVYTHMKPEEQQRIKDSKAKLEPNDSCGPLEANSSACVVYAKNSDGTITKQEYKRVIEEDAESERFNLGRVKSFWAPEDYSNSGFPVELTEPKQIETAVRNLETVQSLGTRYLAEQEKAANNLTEKSVRENADKNLDKAIASL